ncbi:MAG: WYL domain-containing protein [Bryobacteraceae bacterium]
MKASRLLSELLLLQAKGRVTTRQVAERLEISQRTAHRDMEALCAAGVPLVALRGASGGWELDRAWRTQVPALDEKELQGLFMAQLGSFGGDGLASSTERALTKLVAALPSAARAQVALIRERFYVDPEGWGPWSEDLSALPLVQEALVREVRLRFQYSGVWRTVEPLGAVCKQTVWYLVAGTHSGLRTFRVSRISDAAVLPEGFVRPRDFDLAGYWRASTAELQERRKRFSAVLALSRQAVSSVGRWTALEVVNASEVLPDGWTTVQVRFDGEGAALFVVLGLGSEVRVVEPESLKAKVLRVAGEVVAMSEEAGKKKTL